MSDELDEILDGLSKEMSKEEIKDVVVQEEDAKTISIINL